MESFDRYRRARESILYTLAYFDVIDYAPTWPELLSWIEWSGSHGFVSENPPAGTELAANRDHLVQDHVIESGFGRLALPGRLAPLAALSLERTTLWNRKVRRARRMASLFLRLRSIRFIALANTTALAHARNEGDLDFFVVTRAGTIWSTRLMSAGPLRFLGQLSGPRGSRDPICLSYFISDDALDLSSHLLSGDDVYFRYWFLSLLPLYDDGVGDELWKQSGAIRAKHPRAEQWRVSPDLALHTPRVRIAHWQWLEVKAKQIQLSWFPSAIKDSMNQATDVMVTDQALKFHVDDGRAEVRARYEERLRVLGLQ